jgi:hypothetical protein
MNYVVGIGFFALMGALPLLPLVVRPLCHHKTAIVRYFAKAVAFVLMWLTFDVSLMAIWGALGIDLEGWLAPALAFAQIPAAWASARVVFGEDRRST